VIMAGGRAARFGGVDKAFIPLHGRPLVHHVIARVAPQVGTLVINANGAADRFASFGFPVIADRPVGHPVTGPFLGLVSTIEMLCRRSNDETDLLLAVPTDTPFLPGDLLSRLRERQASRNAEVAYATGLDGEHPTVALWAMTAFAGILEAFRRQPTLSMRNLVRAFAGVPVCLDDECGNALFNINTMEDLRTAESHIAAPSSS